MRGICEGVEHHLWLSDFQPYRGIRALRSSKPITLCTAVREEGGGLLTEECKVKASWASNFQRLYQADPPAVELDVRIVSIAEPPIKCGPPSFVETQAVVNWLKWGKAPGISGIHAEFLKAGGNAAIIVACSSVLCLEHRRHLN